MARDWQLADKTALVPGDNDVAKAIRTDIVTSLHGTAGCRDRPARPGSLRYSPVITLT